MKLYNMFLTILTATVNTCISKWKCRGFNSIHVNIETSNYHSKIKFTTYPKIWMDILTLLPNGWGYISSLGKPKGRSYFDVVIYPHLVALIEWGTNFPPAYILSIALDSKYFVDRACRKNGMCSCGVSGILELASKRRTPTKLAPLVLHYISHEISSYALMEHV